MMLQGVGYFALKVATRVGGEGLPQISPWWLIVLSFGIATFPILASVASSYLKVSVILSMLRSGFGAQGVPSSLVVMALSFSTTLLIMGPVWQKSYYAFSLIPREVFESTPTNDLAKHFQPVLTPWREFMNKHAGEREVQYFGGLDVGAHEGDPSFSNLAAAFLVSELKEAFTMGFVVLVPFLVIDLIVANVLAGMGMMMASPVMIALPLKVFVFILADGWLLLSKGLISSYGIGN